MKRTPLGVAAATPCLFATCGFDLISDALPFGRLWYAGRNAVANAIGYAMHRSCSQ